MSEQVIHYKPGIPWNDVYLKTSKKYEILKIVKNKN